MKSVLKNTLGKLLKFIPSFIKGEKVPAVTTTLNPELLLAKREDALPALKQEVRVLAGTYVPGRIRELFGNVAKMFKELFVEYRKLAEQVLGNSFRIFKSMEVLIPIDVEAATTELKAEMNLLAQKRLDLIDKLRKKSTVAKTEFRRLTIGITGNPVIPVKTVEIGFVAILPIVASLMVSMYFEVIFNAPILQNQGDWNMAIAFSILVSFAGSLTTFFAGQSKRAQLNHKNAEMEKRSCFPSDIDPETKKKAEVFPMSGDAKYKRKMWHILMALVITGTLIIRFIMMTQLGDIAGSFGVLLVFAVLYGWEVVYAEVNHPLAKECLAKKKEAGDAQTGLKLLEENIVYPDAKAAFDSYVSGLNKKEQETRVKANSCKQAGDTFLRLANEFLASSKWFTKRFSDSIENMESMIGNARKEEDEELDAMVVEINPEFLTTLSSFNLQSAMQEVSSTANVEVKGCRMTATEFDAEMNAINGRMVEERAKNVVNKPEEETQNTPAPTQVTVIRSGWRVPRLTTN